MIRAKYEAVTKSQLIGRLGGMCSPMKGKEGYVIGPDIYGRICHTATCTTMREAEKYAEELNTKFGR